MFKVSHRGIALIQEFEAFRSKAYLDAKGVPTIGYGTTRIKGQPVQLGMTCTHEQAIEWLFDDVRPCERLLNTSVFVPLNQNQVDALISFMYNVGQGGWLTSTLRRVINARQPVREDHFTRWNKIRDPKTKQLRELPGLTRRRKMEYALFIEPVASDTIGA